MVLGCIPFTFNNLLVVLQRLRKRDGAVDNGGKTGVDHRVSPMAV